MLIKVSIIIKENTKEKGKKEKGKRINLPGAPPTSVPRVTVYILLYEIGFQYIYIVP